MKPAKFQIVKFDPGAAKFIGFAKQQCQRLIDNGTDDFYRFWNMGGGITIKAKSYCGSVKLWLEAAAAGGRAISLGYGFTHTGSYFVSSKITTAAGVVTRNSTPSNGTSIPLDYWPGLPNDYKNAAFVSNKYGAVDATTGHATISIEFTATNDSSKITAITYDVESILPGGQYTSTLYGSWLLGTDVIVLLNITDLSTTKTVAFSRDLKTATEVPSAYTDLSASSNWRVMPTKNVLWIVAWSSAPVVYGIKRATAALNISTNYLTIAGFLGTPDIQATQNYLGIFGLPSGSTNVELFRIDENLSVSEAYIGNAEVTTALGVSAVISGGGGGFAGSGLLLTDTTCQCRFEASEGVTPYTRYEMSLTFTGLSVAASAPNGHYLSTIFSNGLTLYIDDPGYNPVLSVYDGATLLTTFTGTQGTPWYIGVIGASAHAVYIIDYTDAAQLFPIWRFDRATAAWTQVVSSTGRYYTDSTYLNYTHPTLCVTPDADFVMHADFSSGLRDILACNSDGYNFVVATSDSYLAGSYPSQQEKVYYAPTSRVLLFNYNIAIYDVGKPTMAAASSVSNANAATQYLGVYVPAFTLVDTRLLSPSNQPKIQDGWRADYLSQIAALQPP